MIKPHKLLGTSLLFLSLNAQAVSLDIILKSSNKYYPEINKAKLKFQIDRFKYTKNQGAFDSKIIGKSQQRTDGYYDGDTGVLKIVKPLQFLNSKIEGGFRQSEGEIPVYEKQDETLSDGEYFIGLNFSLLRDALIDSNRLEMQNQKLEKSISKSKLLNERLKTLKEAEIAYYNYIIYYIITDVYQGLYQLSEKQQVAIEKRAKRGDLARIYITENLQYLTKRKNKLLKAQQDLDVSRLKLELFYRDEKGKVKNIKDKEHTLEFKEIKFDNEHFEREIARGLERNPYFRVFSQMIEQLKNDIRFKESQTLPELNIKLSSADDSGEGLETYRGVENKVSINLEIPLERRKIESDLKISQLMLERVTVERDFYIDKFKNYLLQQQVKMNNLTNAIETSQQEIKYAEKLEEAERIKFFNGDSDLILLNLREQNTVDAKLRLLDFKLKYIKAVASYKAAIVHEEYLKYFKE